MLCKLTIALDLNRSPAGSHYQLYLVHLFASLSSAVSLSILFLTSDTELLYQAWIIDVLHRWASLYPLSSVFFYMTPSLVSTHFGCHPCASQFNFSLAVYLSSSFLPDESPPPSPQPIVSLLPASLFHSAFFLSELDLACLSQV